MKIDFSTVTEEGLWRFVGKHLSDSGFDAVLVGGAVVSVYSEGAYESGDLDFVIQNLSKERLPEVMKEIGFLKKGKEYRHPHCAHLFVEFPSGPLGIGEDYDIRPREEMVDGSIIKILSPTDSIKDRLASYIYFKDREGMDQAVLIAKSQPFNRSSVKRWCQGERREDVYKDFIKRFR
ncbi:MAG: hypothetical protein ACPGJV_03440 [Bacteriovoracaceae bacterium]